MLEAIDISSSSIKIKPKFLNHELNFLKINSQGKTIS